MAFRTFSLLLCAAPLTILAQEHPIIAAYTLTELEGGIRIDWTIQGGSTCNGQDVERSTDGVTFAQVHRIAGICGSTSNAVPYDWVDNAPPEFSTVYYRLKLGLDGYSSVKSIVFDQLTASDQRFFPSPMADEATLVLNIPSSSSFDLEIADSRGRAVFLRSAVQGNTIRFTLPGAAAGTYSYRATSGSRVFTGQFVKR
ncbi:MAG TPA: T9SS type A sorting domain-containing protein [Flavobacteriales bacterium]|nr:T9SS type A sorting domain-containing protein [Flavobacteriales bacterium]